MLTHDDSSTEAVVQDAFVRLKPRFDEVADRAAYLRTCVVNGCRDRARGENLQWDGHLVPEESPAPTNTESETSATEP